MSNIDKQKMRTVAGMAAKYRLNPKVDPTHLLALLDELDAKDKRIAEMQARDINIKQQAQALFEAIANPIDHYVPAYVRCLREALNGAGTAKGE